MAKSAEDLQRLQLQMQFLMSQAQEVKEQMNALQAKLAELRALSKHLDSLTTLNKSAETWSNIGLNTFVQSKLANTSEVLVNVGANVFMKKNIPSAKETIQSQIELSERYLDQLASAMKALTEHAENLQGQAE